MFVDFLLKICCRSSGELMKLQNLVPNVVRQTTRERHILRRI